MKVTCSACRRAFAIELDGSTMQGVKSMRYCETCRRVAQATWITRSAALALRRAGLEREADRVAGVAKRVALPGSFTRSEVLSGTVKRVGA